MLILLLTSSGLKSESYLYASSKDMSILFMMYAMAMVADREIPARQWTRTLALQAFAFSKKERESKSTPASIHKGYSSGFTYLG